VELTLAASWCQLFCNYSILYQCQRDRMRGCHAPVASRRLCSPTPLLLMQLPWCSFDLRARGCVGGAHQERRLGGSTREGGGMGAKSATRHTNMCLGLSPPPHGCNTDPIPAHTGGLFRHFTCRAARAHSVTFALIRNCSLTPIRNLMLCGLHM